MLPLWRTNRLNKQSSILANWHSLLATKQILYSALILQKSLAKSLHSRQDDLWRCEILRSGGFVSACTKTKGSLPWFAVIVHISFHEHHACPLSPEGLAGIEAAGIVVDAFCLLGAFFEEGDIAFVQCEGRSGVCVTECLYVLPCLIVVIGILRE